jgi:chitin disaccharide deacetylase
MNSERVAIVNADDFGLSAGINRGVVEAHTEGIVTSASLMVRGPASREAAALATAHPRLSVGLHVDLSEWTYRDGEWEEAYAVVAVDDLGAVEQEIRRQLAAFRALCGRDPSHLDSHQHVHSWQPGVGDVLERVGAELGVPVRQRRGGVNYTGIFHGQNRYGAPYPPGIRVETLVSVLRELDTGITEIGCHPARDTDFDSVYRDERRMELATLCDERVRQAVETEGVVLRSFDEI